MKEDNNTGNGCGTVFMLLAGLTALTFVVLKLCKVIAWAWIWVLSPLWIWGIVIVICLILTVVFAVLG
jgi:hypothetical protein